jgi:hypothetical protein
VSIQGTLSYLDGLQFACQLLVSVRLTAQLTLQHLDRGPSREHSGNIWGTLREYLGKFREHCATSDDEPEQGIFRETLRVR